MRKIVISLVLMTLVLGFVFAAETKTDNLAVKLTVTPKLEIKFTSSNMSGDNNTELTSITGNEISLGEGNTGKLTSPSFFVTVRTNYLNVNCNVYGTGLTKYTQADTENAPLEYDKEGAVITLNLSRIENNEKKDTVSFSERVSSDKQRGNKSLPLKEEEVAIKGLRTISWQLEAQADVTGAVQGNYIAYLVAEVVGE